MSLAASILHNVSLVHRAAVHLDGVSSTKMVAMFVLVLSVAGLSLAQPIQTPAPPADRPQAAKKEPPALGFSHMKDVSPLADEDAYLEELEMEKKLPGNPMVHDKRLIHEAGLMNEFMEGFRTRRNVTGSRST